MLSRFDVTMRLRAGNQNSQSAAMLTPKPFKFHNNYDRTEFDAKPSTVFEYHSYLNISCDTYKITYRTKSQDSIAFLSKIKI